MFRFILISSIFLFYSIILNAENLVDKEEDYFNFLDLDKNNEISYKEIDQALKLIFQLIDVNTDNIISKDEIIEFKKIINSF